MLFFSRYLKKKIDTKRAHALKKRR